MTGNMRGLLVSIHDVTPAFDQEIQELWRLCRGQRLVPALLVVPNWHGEWPIEAHPAFIEWISERAAEGAEIILHGERHDEVGLRRGIGDSIRAIGRTAREGEFLTLDYVQASERIERGLQRLRSIGLQPTGFIPPAWLALDATHRAAAAAGLRFSEDDVGVRLHDPARTIRAPALRWSGRTDSRARASVAVAAMRWRNRARTPLLRLALHPQDLANPLTARSVAREMERWASELPMLRYDAL